MIVEKLNKQTLAKVSENEAFRTEFGFQLIEGKSVGMSMRSAWRISSKRNLVGVQPASLLLWRRLAELQTKVNE